MPKRLSNISIKEYKEFLTHYGCSYIRTASGHEIWTRKDLLRPICFQTHINPVPERIIKQGLKALNVSKQDCQRFFD